VSFPDFPEAHTFGDDIEDAAAHARDALATIVDTYIADRQVIPRPSRAARGMYEIRLPALTKAKVDLYNTMRESRVSKGELARRLGVHLPQVNRLLDVRHASRLDQIERALEALGKELFVAALDRQTGRQLRVGAPLSGAAGGLGTGLRPSSRPLRKSSARRRQAARKRR
jgi:antitoxin HicB